MTIEFITTLLGDVKDVRPLEGVAFGRKLVMEQRVDLFRLFADTSARKSFMNAAQAFKLIVTENAAFSQPRRPSSSAHGLSQCFFSAQPVFMLEGKESEPIRRADSLYVTADSLKAALRRMDLSVFPKEIEMYMRRMTEDWFSFTQEEMRLFHKALKAVPHLTAHVVEHLPPQSYYRQKWHADTPVAILASPEMLYGRLRSSDKFDPIRRVPA